MARPDRLSAAAAIVLLALGPAEGQEPSRKGSVTASAEVRQVLVDAYATDRHGNAIEGLAARDFRVRVDGLEVPLREAEWVPASGSEEPRTGDVPPPGTPRFPEGRLIVLFFQTDFARIRLKGEMQMTVAARAYLDRLLPTDRVAVLSYDSQLRFRLDFTRDRSRIERAISDSLRIGSVPRIAPGPFPSLAAAFDYDAAREAATVERGLLATANALERIPGAKALLYLGWGVRVDRTPAEAKWHAVAITALQRARVTVFTLDVTDADYHTLETELELLSTLTGGTYEKANVFTDGALDRVFRRISGRYVLVLDRPDVPEGRHDIQVSLRDRPGDVWARSFFDD